MAEISRQEEAFNYVAQTFLQLIQRDDKIPHKKEVMAFWQDFFEHEGVRNNMIQAFSNFLWEVDLKLDASRKAGIVQLSNALKLAMPGDATHPENLAVSKLISHVVEQQLASENGAEEKPLTDTEVAETDLSEVGGGNEDDTPLL